MMKKYNKFLKNRSVPTADNENTADFEVWAKSYWVKNWWNFTNLIEKLGKKRANFFKLGCFWPKNWAKNNQNWLKLNKFEWKWLKLNKIWMKMSEFWVILNEMIEFCDYFWLNYPIFVPTVPFLKNYPKFMFLFWISFFKYYFIFYYQLPSKINKCK